MSDIGLIWGPLDIAVIALIIGAPGLVLGSTLGLIAWRHHRLWGARSSARSLASRSGSPALRSGR